METFYINFEVPFKSDLNHFKNVIEAIIFLHKYGSESNGKLQLNSTLAIDEKANGVSPAEKALDDGVSHEGDAAGDADLAPLFLTQRRSAVPLPPESIRPRFPRIADAACSTHHLLPELLYHRHLRLAPPNPHRVLSLYTKNENPFSNASREANLVSAFISLIDQEIGRGWAIPLRSARLSPA